jgi:hypothetical protein
LTAGAAPGGDETASPAPGTYLDLAADAWAPALQRFACFGSRVLVCDNLAFSADHVIKRKDTVRAKRELPGLLSEIKSAWRLFNAATFALAGKVTEKPDLTKQLHHVIDGTCERLH